MLKLNVCIITFNHEKYIAQAIESVLMQRADFDYEIVIGEDCSTDNTRHILIEYQKRYPDKIRLLLHEQNLGFYGRFNFIETFKICQGRYVALLEGDDYWTDPYKLQKQVDFLETNPEYGLVHGDVNHLEESSGKLIKNYNRTNKIKIPEGDIFQKLLRGQFRSHPIKTMTACFRKELIDKYFDFEVSISRKWLMGDLAFWLEISKHSKVHYINETLATYRLLNESASRSKNLRKLLEVHKSVFDIRFYYWNKYSKDPSIKEELEKKYYNVLLGDAYKMKNLPFAKKALNYFKSQSIPLNMKQKLKSLITVINAFFPS
jgi:glycosyltransferase involved in cell wall biosynthesis